MEKDIQDAIRKSYLYFNNKLRHLQITKEEKEHFIINNTYLLLKKQYNKETIKQFI